MLALRGTVGGVQELVIQVASYLFLAGILLVFSSIVPAVRRRWPRGFMIGFVTATGSVLLVLAAALLL